MGAMVGSSGSGVYRAAISQSPVTDWRYYGQCPCVYIIVVQLPRIGAAFSQSGVPGFSPTHLS